MIHQQYNFVGVMRECVSMAPPYWNKIFHAFISGHQESCHLRQMVRQMGDLLISASDLIHAGERLEE